MSSMVVNDAPDSDAASAVASRRLSSSSSADNAAAAVQDYCQCLTPRVLDLITWYWWRQHATVVWPKTGWNFPAKSLKGRRLCRSARHTDNSSCDESTVSKFVEITIKRWKIAVVGDGLNSIDRYQAIGNVSIWSGKIWALIYSLSYVAFHTFLSYLAGSKGVSVRPLVRLGYDDKYRSITIASSSDNNVIIVNDLDIYQENGVKLTNFR